MIAKGGTNLQAILESVKEKEPVHLEDEMDALLRKIRPAMKFPENSGIIRRFDPNN